MTARGLTRLCLVLATAIAASTGALSERIDLLLRAETASTLGGDLVLRSREAPEPRVEQSAREFGLTVAQEISMPTLAFAGEDSELIGLRVVGDNWPLRGQVQTASGPQPGGPEPGTLWIATTLADALQVGRGDTLEIGARLFRVGAITDEAPGRGNAGFSSLAPQVLMSQTDLESSGLLVAGARSRWYTYVAGEPAALERFRSWAEKAELRIEEPGDVRPEIGNALSRASRLLELATLCSLVLLAAVVFLLGRYRHPQWAYETAVLRSIGAGRQQIWARLGRPWLLDLLIASGMGIALAAGGQMLLGSVVLRSEGISLPASSFWPYLVAALASIAVAGIQLPQLRRAITTPPALLFRQSEQDQAALATGSLWTAVSLLLVSGLVSRDPLVIGASVGVVLGGGLILTLGAWALLRVLPAAGPLTPLGQLQRQGWLAAVQVGALGLGLSILLLLGGLQSQIIAPWQAQLPPDAPNRFVINIQPDQREALAETLAKRGIRDARLMPMVRGRLVALNGQAVTVDDFDDPETQRWINRDFNLSSAATLPNDNVLRDGAFWPADSTRPEISADIYAVERLGLKIGSTLTLAIAGADYQYTVTSLREVQWDSMQPNFFLVVPPGALPEAGASWVTSYYQPPELQTLDRELVRQFPNLTLLNLERLISEIRRITGRALTALQLVFSFTLVSGLLLVVSMLLGQLPARRRHIAVLRALGISRQQLRQLMQKEFALLGFIAGAGCVAVVQVSLGLLATQVFDMPWAPQLPGILLPPVVAAIVCALGGWSLLRSATMTPPARLLAAS